MSINLDTKKATTFEASVKETLHPDVTVVARLREVSLSDCPNGCKVYADPRSDYTVVGHNSAYGCRR